MGAGHSSGLEIDGSSMGYQVLRVHPNSPGSRAGLKAYFDFIVAIGNTRFNKEDGSLREILKASVDEKLKMIIYNTRTRKTREIEITPSTSWGGNGLLGVSIKHSSFDRAEERVWHVVEVEPGSPAQQAGFISNEDYVIGSDSILQENDDLYNLVEAHEGKSLKLFVYNTKTDNCRDVICHPNSRWGGKGYLGCEFGHGLLHRIPYSNSNDHVSNNPRASLLRNEQPVATQQIDQNYNNFSLQRALAQQQQLRQSQPEQQSHQKPLKQQGVDDAVMPQAQAPKTFAQLANAEYQFPVQNKTAQDNYNQSRFTQANILPQQPLQQSSQHSPQQQAVQQLQQQIQQPAQQQPIQLPPLQQSPQTSLEQIQQSLQQQSIQISPQLQSMQRSLLQQTTQHQPMQLPLLQQSPQPPLEQMQQSLQQQPPQLQSMQRLLLQQTPQQSLQQQPIQLSPQQQPMQQQSIQQSSQQQPMQQQPIQQSSQQQSMQQQPIQQSPQQQPQVHQSHPEQRQYQEAIIEARSHQYQGMGDTGPPLIPPQINDSQYQYPVQSQAAQENYSQFGANQEDIDTSAPFTTVRLPV